MLSNFIEKYKKVVFVFALIVVVVVGMFASFRFFSEKNVALQPEQESLVVDPARTHFGTELPEGFPADILFEDGVTLNQSYALDYPGQKQLTIVFVSREGMKKNYDLYNDFFQKEGWVVSSQYESESLSSLYALKDQNEINVTISAGEAGAEVSVSVLKK